MKRKWFILVIIAILGLLSIIGGVFFYREKIAVGENPSLNNTIVKDMSKQAPFVYNLSECEKYPFDSSTIYDCYRNKAVSARDLRICDVPQIQGWKYFCYNSVARETNNESICDIIHNSGKLSADLCYIHVAWKTNNSNLCKKVEHVFQERCYINIAAANDRPEVCESIKTQKSRDECYLQVVLAEFKKNPEICKMINNSEDKAECNRTASIGYWSRDFI